MALTLLMGVIVTGFIIYLSASIHSLRKSRTEVEGTISKHQIFYN
ncbi:MAG TPA: hypothetical protein VH917_02725 [Ignavibacteriaceae bacterium]